MCVCVCVWRGNGGEGGGGGEYRGFPAKMVYLKHDI